MDKYFGMMLLEVLIVYLIINYIIFTSSNAKIDIVGIGMDFICGASIIFAFLWGGGYLPDDFDSGDG